MPLITLPSGTVSRVSSANARAVPVPRRATVPRDRNWRRSNMTESPDALARCERLNQFASIAFATAFTGGSVVILLDQLLVLGHEPVLAVGVHLLAERFGEMAPDVFVDVGDLVWLALLAAVAATGSVAGLLRLTLILLI